MGKLIAWESGITVIVGNEEKGPSVAWFSADARVGGIKAAWLRAEKFIADEEGAGQEAAGSEARKEGDVMTTKRQLVETLERMQKHHRENLPLWLPNDRLEWEGIVAFYESAIRLVEQGPEEPRR